MDYCAGYVSSVSQRSWIGQEGIMYGADVPQLGDTSGTGFSDPHVFDGMQTPSFSPTLQGRVLNVVIHQVKHSVPIDVLNHLFSSYGVVEKIFLSSSQHGRTILIQYQHDYMADNALRATHGWYLYGTYCQLNIRHAYHVELQILYDYSCAFLSEINTSEQKPHHATETESISDMLAHIQAKLKTVSENLSQDLKHMKSWESKQPDSSQPNPSTQEAINMSNEMPVYDVYEDVTACRSRIHPTADIIEAEQVQVKEDSGNPRISLERPTNEKKPDNEGIFLCVNKASYHTFGEEAADFIFPHGPVIHADRSIKLTNEKSSQAAHMLFVQGATVHCTDVSSEINIKKPDVLIKKHDITSPCDLNNDKEVPIVLKYQLPLSSTTNTWDPGVLNIIDMMLDKYTLLNQVQFGHRIAELSFLSLTAYKQYTAPNGIKNVLHDTSFILQRAANLSQGNYLCFLYCNSVLKSEYCQMRCLWEFSIKLATRLQWDPGDTVTMHSYTETHPIVTHFSRSKWQPLWMESNISMWWKSSMEQIAYLPWDPGPGIHCAEIIGCSPANLIQQGRNVALEVHFWRSMCNAMHYCQIFQRYTAMSSLLYWHQHIKFNGIALWLITFNPP